MCLRARREQAGAEGAVLEVGAGKRRELAGRLLPFALSAVGSLLLAWWLPRPNGGPALPLAALLTVAVLASAFVLPWGRMPPWTRGIPPLVYCGAVAALREATGGAASGFTVALLIPVFWSALFATWRQLVAVVVASVAALVVPIVALGPPLYPPSEWRRVAAWLLVAPLVGWTVQRLVSQASESARAARRRAAALSESQSRLAASERTLTAVARLVRSVPIDADARGRVCEAARQLAEAASVVLVEMDEHGMLSSTASAGELLAPLSVDPRDRRLAVAEAFHHKRRLYVEGERASAQLPPPLVASGARAVLHQPVIRGDDAIGVLVVAWHEPQQEVKEPVAQALALLAAEAAAIVERADLLAQARAQARFDPLTGLANRRAWDEALGGEIARARRDGHPVAIGIIDLDRFKDFNDRFGHPRGDELLAEAAARWRSRLRDIDLLARWGGEEFTVLLPNCGPDEARRVVERIRAATPEGQTCSAGVAVWDGVETADALLARADEALYAAKTAGRDRTVLASP